MWLAANCSCSIHYCQASVSSPGVEPGPRPSQGRVRSATLRERVSFQRPAEESNLVRQFRGLPCSSGTPAGRSFQCLDQDLNLDLDLRRVLCDPLHHRDIFNKYPDLESNQVQGFRKALCDPLHHRDKPEPTTGFAPASSGLQDRRLSQSSHVGFQAGVQGFEPCWAALEAASSPRRTLLYRPPVLRPGARCPHHPTTSRSRLACGCNSYCRISNSTGEAGL